MTRRYDEPIEVTSALADPDGVEPEAFIWRGRLFVVRAVLDRWHERRAWWREVGPGVAAAGRPGVAVSRAGRVALAEGPSGGAGGRRPVSSGGGGSGDRPHEAGLGDFPAERERQVWRVEASPGRVAGTGVFDLGSDGTGPDGSPRWVLLCAHD